MSVNSSTSTDLLLHYCSNMFTAVLSIRALLLLPLSTFVLYLGLQRWRKRRSFETSSLSDIFTYNLAAMELLWVFGYLCKICVDYFNLSAMKTVGLWAALNTFYGEFFFHILTCAERYIAVVFPVTYLSLRNTCGVRIRNISTGCVWLLCLVMISLNQALTDSYQPIPLYCLLAFTILATSFFSLSVLCVLIRPGPGEGGGEKERVDQSKKKAFVTITVILSAQWFWILGLLVSTALTKTSTLRNGGACFVTLSTGLCNVPSNLVLPLLYLHKEGKLARNCFNPE